MLEKQFQSALFDRCGVLPGQRILVGFSGGADSLCLLHLLKSQPLELIAAHFNHRLRPESDSDAASCLQTAENWGLKFIAETGDVRAYADLTGLSIEESARILRYRFLYRAAASSAADAVAVAHHADDQVETVLMHLVRGSGPGGLAGMQFRSGDPLSESDIPLLRPLLSTWRSEIDRYCAEHRLVPLVDATNQNPAYFRNRIRLDLVPELETYNLEFKQHLWQTASIIGEENAWLETETAKKLAQALIRKGDRWTLIHVGGLKAEPKWLVRRLVRQIIFSLKDTLRDLSFAEVERAVGFLEHPAFDKTCQMTADIELLRYDRQGVLFAEKGCLLGDLWPQLTAPQTMRALQPLPHPFPGGWVLSLERLDPPIGTPLTENPWECLLDADRLVDSLTLGVRKPGDVFMPFGMQGASLKLGDFFTNVHLPGRARDAWPLVRSGERIVWIPGYRMAEFCKLTPETRNILKLTLVQENKKPA